MLDRILLAKVKKEAAITFGYKNWEDVINSLDSILEKDALVTLVAEKYSEEVLKQFTENNHKDDIEAKIQEHRMVCPRLRNGNECDDPDWDCYSTCTGNCEYMKSYIRELRNT